MANMLLGVCASELIRGEGNCDDVDKTERLQLQEGTPWGGKRGQASSIPTKACPSGPSWPSVLSAWAFRALLSSVLTSLSR